MLVKIRIEGNEHAEGWRLRAIGARRCDEVMAEELVAEDEVVEGKKCGYLQARPKNISIDGTRMVGRSTYCSPSSSRC